MYVQAVGWRRGPQAPEVVNSRQTPESGSPFEAKIVWWGSALTTAFNKNDTVVFQVSASETTGAVLKGLKGLKVSKLYMPKLFCPTMERVILFWNLCNAVGMPFAFILSAGAVEVRRFADPRPGRAAK